MFIKSKCESISLILNGKNYFVKPDTNVPNYFSKNFHSNVKTEFEINAKMNDYLTQRLLQFEKQCAEKEYLYKANRILKIKEIISSEQNIFDSI